MDVIPINVGFVPNITLFGNNFQYTNGVFLSSNRNTNLANVSAYNFFSNVKRLSSICPPFSGQEINNYTVVNSNTISVGLTSITTPGTYDIIIKNDGGYFKTSSAKTLLLKRDTSIPTPTPTPTPTPAPPSACIEGWSYTNFQGATFRNGDPIPEITDQEAWNTATGPGWCYFDNDPANDAIYGKLYNRYAVADIRGLAPEGFHIPTLAEWVDLITCLGGSDAGGGIWPVAGAKMKTTGTIQDGDGLWNTPNVATNESLFSVEPAGCRTGGFINLHTRGSFWVYDSDTCINFNNGASYVYIGGDSATVGYSIRLKAGPGS